jgi:hypothetical protein
MAVSAIDWPFGKSTYCQFGQYNNSIDCDISWCNNVLTNSNQTCNYNQNESICKCTQIITINETVILNTTVNTTNNTITFDNSSFDALKKELKDYSDNQTIYIRNNLLDRIENKTFTTTYSGSSENNTPGYIWIIVALILMGGLYAISGRSKTDRSREPQDAFIQNQNKYKRIVRQGNQSEEQAEEY